jgi:hypothetical protein
MTVIKGFEPKKRAGAGAGTGLKGRLPANSAFQKQPLGF